MLKIHRRFCALVVCLPMLAAPAAGQSLTARLVVDARDGRLDELGFITGALIASGVEDRAELDRWLTSYLALRGEMLAAIERAPDGQRLSPILAELKQRLLVGRYDETATDVRIVLARGDFNCLSMAAIAVDLCQAAQCDVHTCLTRGHVALISTDDDQSDSIRQASQRVRRLTPVELLGKFYYNRGIAQLREQRFAEGIELLETSLKLDPQDEDARANVAAGLNNWAAMHLRANRLMQAAALIERGRRLDPALAPLIANERLVRSSKQD